MANQKIDQRKWISPETMAKKSAAGRKGKGGSALTRKHKSTRDPDLQKRIELVVKMALSADGMGVFHDRVGLFRSGRVRGSKVG